MLPSNLLVTVSRKGTIRPRYMLPSPRSYALLEDIIALFKSCVKRKRAYLEEHLQEYEVGLDYKVVRGLATLLKRRCRFESHAPLDPLTVRHAVFQRSSDLNVSTLEERDWVIRRCAEELHTTPEDIEASLYADREQEQVLTSFKDIGAEALLRQYNLSLVQTLMFRARSMVVEAPEGYLDLISTSKSLGLMYQVEGSGNALRLMIEGPLSMFRMCERYGTLMARLIPRIVTLPEWRVIARIAPKKGGTGGVQTFTIDSDSDGHLLVPEEVVPADGEGPSGSRTRLISRLTRALPDWEIDAEPEIISREGVILSPDLVLRKGGQTICLEMLGFWTEDFLRKRGDVLAASGVADLGYITFVERRLAGSREPGVPQEGTVLLHDRKARVDEIVKAVRRYEREHPAASEPPDADARRTGERIPITGDVLDLEALAEKYDTTVETLLESLGARGYIRIRNMLVSISLAERLAAGIMRSPAYPDACALLKRAGIPHPDDALRELGFTVIWNGIDPSKAVVRYAG